MLAEVITLISLLENRKAGIIFLIRNKFPTNLKLRMNRLNNAITAAAIVTSAVAANVRPTDYKQIGVNDAWFNMRYVPEVDQVEFIVSMNCAATIAILTHLGHLLPKFIYGRPNIPIRLVIKADR